MKAAAKPDAAFVRDLLAQGANPLIKDSPWGDTALDKSVYEAIKFGGDRKRFDVYLEVIRSLKAIPGTSLRKAISVQLDEKIRLHTPSVHGELEQDSSRLKDELASVSARPEAPPLCPALPADFHRPYGRESSSPLR